MIIRIKQSIGLLFSRIYWTLPNKVIVIDHGRLAEQGTHDELIASGGLYSDMYYKQLAEEN